VNVAIVILDCVRADHVGCYGYPKDTTPNLDALAADATQFLVDVSAGVWTLPSMASMLTGLHPSQHGLNRADRRLGRELVTLPQRLGEAGWRTAAFSANPHVGRAFGLDRGFDEVHELWGVPGAGGALGGVLDRGYRWLRPKVRGVLKRSQRLTSTAMRLQRRRAEAGAGDGSGRRLADAAASFMRHARADGRPWFALVHFMESHVPYAPPAAVARRFLDEAGRRRVQGLDHDAMAFLAGVNPLGEEDLALLAALYDATIRYGDELLAPVLDAAGDDALVIVTADHGQHLGDHGLMGHFFSVYEALAHVPLVVRHPGLPGGQVERPVQSIDLFPTVLEAAGIDPGPLPGVSLSAASDPRPVLVTEYLEPDLARFARFRGFDPAPFDRELRALQHDRHKYIWSSDGREELYDLASDPGERTDLAAVDPDRLDAFRTLHRAWLADAGGLAAAAADARDGDLDPEVATSLRALGYFD
jgi:arylsulfatase A-like enzyme